MGHMHLAKSYGANIVLSLLVQICCCASTDSFFAEPVDLFIQERSRTCYRNEAALAARTKPHLQERSCTCKNEAVKTSSQVHSCCICKCINTKQMQTRPKPSHQPRDLHKLPGFDQNSMLQSAEHDRTCVLFVQWLDGMYKSNANKGQSIYQAAQPISRSMGHMHLAKSYGRGEDSAYQLQTISSGSVLAPVWLVPDQSCKDGSTFFAIKNDELPGFDQNATL